MRARLLASVVLTSAVPLAGTAAAASTTTVTVRDHSVNRGVVLAKGARLKIVLASNNPSTGYHWVYAARPRKAVLALVSDRTVTPPQTTPPTVGAPAPRTIVYRARAAGSTSIRLRLVPPGSTTTAQTVTLRVRVPG